MKNKIILILLACLLCSTFTHAAGTFTLHGKAGKTTLDDADVFGIEDSSASWAVKKVTIADLVNKVIGDGPVLTTNPAGLIDETTGVFDLDGFQVKTVSKVTTTDYTIGTTSANELFSGIIIVTGASTVTAPAIAPGHTYIIVTRGDITVSLDVNASDVMTLDGFALSAGDKATNTSKSGDTIACTYVAANDLQCWSSTVLGGHWTDGN